MSVVIVNLSHHPRKMVLLLIGAILFTNACTACNRNHLENSSSSDMKRSVIGFSLATLKEDRWLRDRDIFVAKAKQAGFDVILSNSNNNSKMQYEQVEDMIRKNVDILVIAPQDRDDAARCVQDAKKAGIPVVSYDRLIRNADVDVYVSFDTEKIGKIQAKILLDAAPQGGYLIVNGSKDDNNTTLTHRSCMAQLQPSIASGRVRIVAETWVKDWRREGAYEFVHDQLKLHPAEITGIIAGNDSLAWGVIDALSEAKLARKVLVAGMDADLAACQRIVDGTQLMTVYKPIEKFAEQVVDVCKTLSRGEKISSIKTINDGTYNVPYIVVDVIGVTKENIDETVIKDGFQLKEDVYRTDTPSSEP